ncbi:MAG: HAD-IIB family hydrolase [Deltaproteobacteria bacterium]|nr:MAG: HAD-IIB family hydrolase [Deltaproteobacteria bacterium]
MRYLAVATDYDGTLAEQGTVRPETVAAVERLRKSGRRVVLVTGRELRDLQTVFDRFDLFDLVVAENGALLYRPQTREEKCVAEPPPPALAERLRQRGATPLHTGRVIVATREPYEVAAVEVVRELGLEWQVIFNKGAVMLLPSGVNKQTGLTLALEELCLSMRNTVAVGDAENDHAMLAASECGVAVANALDSLKERADLVTRGARGAGVEELIDRIIEDDLRSVVVARHALLLGTRRDGTESRIAPAGRRLLIAGPSGSGKTTVATGFIERLMAAGYQCCIVDSEGDYGGFEGLVSVGTQERAPAVGEILELLAKPSVHVAVSMVAVPVNDRPAFFATLLPRLQELRARTGRPHWIVIDEAHHLFPASWQPAPLTLPRELGGVLMVTANPQQVSPAMLETVDTALAVGKTPERALQPFGRVPPVELEDGEVLAWSNGQAEPLRLVQGKAQMRHRRKYAAGVGGDAFVFRGPQGKLKLRAQNLGIFLQMAEGVDEETWMHHLARRDYSKWFRTVIKDDALAAEAEQIEGGGGPESRDRIRDAIGKRYTLPE